MVRPVNGPVRLRREIKWIHRRCAVSNVIERRGGRDPNALATMVLTAEEVAAAPAVRAVIVVAVSREVVVEVSGGVVVVADGNGKSSVSEATTSGATPRIL
jgi:hypothetical protein